jgi:hypothetical protein
MLTSGCYEMRRSNLPSLINYKEVFIPVEKPLALEVSDVRLLRGFSSNTLG